MATKFTKDHEWVDVKDGVATVGITHYAQEQLGDLVYAELPEIGRQIKQGGEICVVESTKAASEVYAPISGEVIEVNSTLEEDPGKVNSDPHGAGWLIKIKVEDEAELSALLDEEGYSEFVNGQG